MKWLYTILDSGIGCLLFLLLGIVGIALVLLYGLR